MSADKAPSPVPMRPVVIRMSPSMYSEVKHIAEQTDRSFSWIVRRAVREYVDRSS